MRPLEDPIPQQSGCGPVWGNTLDVSPDLPEDYMRFAVASVIKQAPIVMAYTRGSQIHPVLYNPDVTTGRHGGDVWTQWLSLLLSMTQAEALLLLRGYPLSTATPDAENLPDHAILIASGVGHVFRSMPDGSAELSSTITLDEDFEAILQIFSNF